MKMFLQCHGCGFTECLDLDEGHFDAREKELNRVIEKGWRFASAWDGFVCPTCSGSGGTTDQLFALVAGSPRICSGISTYVELRERAEKFENEWRTFVKEADE